jgi:hypothetical protein
MKKNEKKLLTSFLWSAIELENFNFLVRPFHKSREKGGENG